METIVAAWVANLYLTDKILESKVRQWSWANKEMVSDAEAAATMATSVKNFFFVAWRIDRILQYIQ